jgi:hypothetical protein
MEKGPPFSNSISQGWVNLQVDGIVLPRFRPLNVFLCATTNVPANDYSDLEPQPPKSAGELFPLFEVLQMLIHFNQ